MVAAFIVVALFFLLVGIVIGHGIAGWQQRRRDEPREPTPLPRTHPPLDGWRRPRVNGFGEFVD